MNDSLNFPVGNVPVTEHTLTLTLLAYLVDRADRGEIAQIVHDGLSPEDLDDLRGMPFGELLRVTDQQQAIFYLGINRRLLRYCMMRQQHQTIAESDILWFIGNAAPAVLMQKLFGVGANEFRELRRVSGLDPRPGRPRRPDDATVAMLRKHWASISSGTPLSARYRTLADAHPDVPLGSIYAALEGDR